MVVGNTLCRDERLRGERTISQLFDKGKTFFQAPYKVFWNKSQRQGQEVQIQRQEGQGQALPLQYSCRFAVSVPRRRFKRATKRNLLKRRTREAFRTNKQILNLNVTKREEQIHLILIYSIDKILPFIEIDEAVKKILQRISKRITE